MSRRERFDLYVIDRQLPDGDVNKPHLAHLAKTVKDQLR
jgi:hypothetical protein